MGAPCFFAASEHPKNSLFLIKVASRTRSCRPDRVPRAPNSACGPECKIGGQRCRDNGPYGYVWPLRRSDAGGARRTLRWRCARAVVGGLVAEVGSRAGRRLFWTVPPSSRGPDRPRLALRHGWPRSGKLRNTPRPFGVQFAGLRRSGGRAQSTQATRPRPAQPTRGSRTPAGCRPRGRGICRRHRPLTLLKGAPDEHRRSISQRPGLLGPIGTRSWRSRVPGSTDINGFCRRQTGPPNDPSTS